MEAAFQIQPTQKVKKHMALPWWKETLYIYICLFGEQASSYGRKTAACKAVTVAMASNLLAMASNLIAMASNLIAMVSTFPLFRKILAPQLVAGVTRTRERSITVGSIRYPVHNDRPA